MRECAGKRENGPSVASGWWLALELADPSPPNEPCALRPAFCVSLALARGIDG